MDFTIQVAVVLTVVVAAVTDIRFQRVPNWLTLSGSLAAFALHGLSGGWGGLLFAGTGLAAGFALLIGFYAAGGMGAGDVKLLATVGAFVGPSQVLWVFLFAALAGGVYALGLLCVAAVGKAEGSEPLPRLGTGIKTFVLTGGDIRGLLSALRSYPKLRYAVVIALGVAATRLLDGSLS